MKCDELEEYYYYEDTVITPSTHLYRVYHADKVDKVIAEKDEEIARLEAIRKVHVEAVYSMVAGLHQDYKEILRLRRALWLARAERAKDKQQLFHFSLAYDKLCIDGFYNPSSGRRELSPKQWIKVFNKVENKCLAKAEEYK